MLATIRSVPADSIRAPMSASSWWCTRIRLWKNCVVSIVEARSRPTVRDVYSRPGPSTDSKRLRGSSMKSVWLPVLDSCAAGR